MNGLDIAYALTLGPHFLWHRLVTGKYGPKVMEKTGRVPDRFRGADTVALGAGDPHYEAQCLWLHAVSVGEVIASLELADMFMRDNPRWDIKVSTTTATGREVAERHFGADKVFYFPLDFSGMVARAFDRIRPSLVVLMELEIWPNFLAEAVRRGVPVAVANARITERSVKRLSWAPRVAGNMATAVEAWFAQTETYAERLRRIGVPGTRIDVTGSVKYDAIPPEIDAVRGKYYRRLFGCRESGFCDGGDLLVVAGSTHPGEEKTLLESLRRALPDGAPRPRVVLAPRHPERLDEVEKTAREFGTVVRRSALWEPPPAAPRGDCDADIVLVDTMGELSRIYAAADLVFVGGTLVRHGGQNFLEPCGLARPTVVGPHVWNFAEPAELLRSNDLFCMVDGAEQLPEALRRLLADPAAAAAMGERARSELLKQRGAARRMADHLKTMAKSAMCRK